MLIALDYDGTYTKDKMLWDFFIERAKKNGHEIICFTMRYPDEVALKIPCQVVYTSRKAKLKFARDNGYNVDIWIDDRPAWLFEDALARD
jgi:hypothetical protein